MNKKKIAITVLLSAMLAFLVAWCIFNLTKKPKTIDPQLGEEAQVQSEVQIQEEINEQAKVKKEGAKKEVSKNINRSETKQVVAKPVVQKSENMAIKDASKEEGTKPSVLEEHVEENLDGVIVPVSYVSKNVYKYTYTPKRFPKKK